MIVDEPRREFRLRLKRPDGQSVEVVPSLVVAGIDFGFTDPFVIEVGAKIGSCWLNFYEVYEERMGIPDILKTTLSVARRFRVDRFWADGEDPQMISYLQSHGILVQAAGIKDVMYGIQAVYSLMKQRVDHPVLGPGPKFRVDRRACPNLVREATQYGHAVVRGEVRTGKPMDKHNHCLHGETWVETLVGPERIADLVGQDGVWVWSVNSSGTIVAKQAFDIRQTGSRQVTVKVRFDQGVLIATPDHRVRLVDGTWRQVKDLKAGDRVLSVYTCYRDGYLHMKSAGGWRSAHKLVDESVNGPLPAGWTVHHQDENKLNNLPNNLKRMTRFTHNQLHSVARAVARRAVGYVAWNKQERAVSQCVVCGGVFTQRKVKAQNRMTCSRACWSLLLGDRRGRAWAASRLKGGTVANHVVIAVEPAGVADVYNMEVEDTHCFVANDVVVHNCWDTVRYYVTSEGEIPPDLYEPQQKRHRWMYVGKDGKWLDDPIGHQLFVARTKRDEPGLWWDEKLANALDAEEDIVGIAEEWE